MWIKKIKNFFLRNFYCPTIFCDGHIPVKEVRESDFFITQWKCKRCDCTLGLGHYKNIPPPPGSNEEQRKEWYKFRQEKLKQLRTGINEY